METESDLAKLQESETSGQLLEARLDELHQMLYRRGGIRPVNSAMEELSKLLLLHVQCDRSPNWEVPGHGPIASVLDPEHIRNVGEIDAVKAAFRSVIRLPKFAAPLPDGGTQTIWPADEPLRIDRADVVAEALEILRDHLSLATQRDVLGTAFDVFLRGRYDHAGGLGTYLTPHQVTAALARLALADLDLLGGELEGPRAGDPCCGTGRFPIAILQELERQVTDQASSGPMSERLRRRLKEFKASGLFGADQSASSVAKARINLLLYGIEQPNVFTVEDSVTDPHVHALRGTLKLILTNPPFGDGQYDSPTGIERTASLLPALEKRARIDPALAFLVRCIDLLDDSGRLGIILPDGLVDGSVLRSALLRNGDSRIRHVSIEANISLPTVAFAPAGTVAKTSALVLRKQKASRSMVFLARADHIGYIRQAGAFAPDPRGNDLPRLAELCTQAWTTQARPREGGAHDGIQVLNHRPLAALVERDALQTVDPARVDPEALRAHAELREAGGVQLRERLQPQARRGEPAVEGTPFVSVLHIDDLGAVAWQDAIRHQPSTPGPPAYPGELIVSLLNPRKLRAAVIPDEYERVLCSSEFGVFVVQGDPYEVLVLLHDARVRAQLAPLGRGTSSSRRRIDATDLLEVYAPRAAPEELRTRAAQLREALRQLRSSALAAARAYRDDDRLAA